VVVGENAAGALVRFAPRLLISSRMKAYRSGNLFHFVFASRHLLQIKLDISDAPLPRSYDPAASPLPKRCSYALM
jgi:hypothetical protein